MTDICNKCHIIKQIGVGAFGTIYMVKYDDKYYAMKIQKIHNWQTKPSTEHNIWREIYFAKIMSKYPEQFSKIYCYQLINNCSHVQPLYSKYHRKRIQSLSKSKYCIKMIFDIKDGIIKDLMKNEHLTDKQLYSFVAQLLYALYIMKKHNFTHADIHNRNIAYKKTNNKTIKLGDISVNTYGYIYSLIDYGNAIHPKFKRLTDENKQRLDNDIFDMKWFMFLLLYGYYDILHLCTFKTPT
jgi:serine/threonine protein kinase